MMRAAELLRGRNFIRALTGLAILAALGLAETGHAQSRERAPERGTQVTPSTREAPPARLPASRQRRGARPASEATLRGKRVAFLVGEGFQDAEALMPMAYLANRGAIISVIGIEPDMIEAYNSDLTLRVERSVNDVSFRHFDALVLPGGRGPAVLREDEDVVEFTRQFFESGRLVAAICHGPQVLVTAGVLEGKHATCYAEVSSELEEAGAKYEDKAVIRDGNLITSRLPEDIPAFSKAVEEALIEMADNRRPSRPRRPGRPSRPDRPSRGPGR